MAEASGIAWTRSTFNPWIGCTKVGPGCDHCYAENQDSRKRWGGVVHWGPGVARMRTSVSNWNGPLKWNRQAPASEFAGRPGFWPVFCASLADVFDNEVDPAWRADLFALIEATPKLSWLLVTKRVVNVAKMVPELWMRECFPRQVRLLVTVVNQQEADRDLPKLLELPVSNGVSYEPALGPVDFRPWLVPYCDGGSRPGPGGVGGVMCHRCDGFGCRHVEWVIVGGESTQGAPARPFSIGWARDAISHCRAAGVAVFVKQVGSNTPGWCLGNRPDGTSEEMNVDCQSWESGEGGQCPEGYCACRIDRAGADPAEWPTDLRVREFPL